MTQRETFTDPEEATRRAIARMSSDIHEIRNLIFVLILIWGVLFAIGLFASLNG